MTRMVKSASEHPCYTCLCQLLCSQSLQLQPWKRNERGDDLPTQSMHRVWQHWANAFYSSIPRSGPDMAENQTRSYSNLKFCSTILENGPDKNEEYHCQTLDNVFGTQYDQYFLSVASIQWLMKYWASSEGAKTMAEPNTTQFLTWVTLCSLNQPPLVALHFSSVNLRVSDYFVCSSLRVFAFDRKMIKENYNPGRRTSYCNIEQACKLTGLFYHG